MHKPRIIFFDIDGTLIDMEKKRITERTLDALRRLQQNGILLAVATGRSPLIVPRFDGVEFDVFLTYNGSYCYDRRGDIFASPIPPQDVQTLIQNAAALGRPVSVAGRTQLLSNGTDDDLTAYYAIGGRAPQADHHRCGCAADGRPLRPLPHRPHHRPHPSDPCPSGLSGQTRAGRHQIRQPQNERAHRHKNALCAVRITFREIPEENTLHYLSGKVIKLKDPQIVKQFDALDKTKPDPAKGE